VEKELEATERRASCSDRSTASRDASYDLVGDLTAALLVRQQRGHRLGLTVASGVDERRQPAAEEMPAS